MPIYGRDCSLPEIDLNEGKRAEPLEPSKVPQKRWTSKKMSGRRSSASHPSRKTRLATPRTPRAYRRKSWASASLLPRQTSAIKVSSERWISVQNRGSVQPDIFFYSHSSSVDSYTVLIGPGYCDTKESMVSSVTPSTVACATKILSKGSL